LSSDPQLLRAEAFREIGEILERDATLLVDRWCRRARQQEPAAERAHRHVLRDDFLGLLKAMGRGLAKINSDDACQHHFQAVAHGEQRWEAGWSLTEVIEDYQLLRLVLLDYLEQALDRSPSSREVMAIGLALDEAIAASVTMYVKYRDGFMRAEERERADQERLSSEALSRWVQIFEYAGWGVALFEPVEFRLAMVNPMFARMHGRPRQELLGCSLLDLVAPETRDQVRERISRARSAGHDQFESLQLGPQGSKVPVLAALSPIKDAHGVVGHLAINLQDIREQKQLEESLRNQTLALSAADRRKDEFLATVAHELRNPLAPLANTVEILRMPDVPPAVVVECLNMADRQLRQLVRLVDDLLDVTRIAQGKVTLRRQVVDVAQAVKSAVESSRSAIDSFGHTLVVNLPDKPLAIEVDPARMEQVLTNLLNNAAKYTEPGGHIEVGVTRETDEAVIRVSDNGIGIEPAILARVFELFVQSDDSATRARGGLGIGLALVQRLLRLHGGSVTAASAGPGQGSEFTVRLPVYRPPAGPQRPAERGQPAAGALSARLLLVDDSTDVAHMLSLLLRRVGHEVFVANDGDSAVEMALKEKPDVIFLDIGLPGRDGYEVAQELRKHAALDRTSLVAMTGYGQEDDVRRAIGAGFQFHLLKPVRLDTLQETVQRCLTERPESD
jgi:PAS domain S-box-containing protein